MIIQDLIADFSVNFLMYQNKSSYLVDLINDLLWFTHIFFYLNNYAYYVCIKRSIMDKKTKSHNCRQLCFSNTYNYFSLYENGADMTFLQLVQLLFKNFINSRFDVKCLHSMNHNYTICFPLEKVMRSLGRANILIFTHV